LVSPSPAVVPYHVFICFFIGQNFSTDCTHLVQSAEFAFYHNRYNGHFLLLGCDIVHTSDDLELTAASFISVYDQLIV